MARLRTPVDVKNDLLLRGVSVAELCRQLQLPEQIVRDLLSGKAKGLRGTTHRAAVLLGLKQGVIEEQPKQRGKKASAGAPA